MAFVIDWVDLLGFAGGHARELDAAGTLSVPPAVAPAYCFRETDPNGCGEPLTQAC